VRFRRFVAPVLATAAASLSLGASAIAQSPMASPLAMGREAEALIERVPAAIRGSCRGTEAFLDGMETAIECEVEEGLVFYSRFRDDAARTAAYHTLVAAASLEPDSGTGCASGASEGTFGEEDGVADGRLLCHRTNGAHISVWTHADEPILAGILLGTDAGFAMLASTWDAARLLATGATGATDEPQDPLVQWASAATASSMYGDDSWSATQATGEPDTTAYGDYPTAWAPSGADIGPQWIELGYDVAVRPSEIVIWESSGAGFVTLVEAVDLATGDWVTLFEGTDGSPDSLVGFSPPLLRTDVVTDRLRITIDTDVPGWNEIDAVALIGVPADPA
jgi:hypothetical protein